MSMNDDQCACAHMHDAIPKWETEFINPWKLWVVGGCIFVFSQRLRLAICQCTGSCWQLLGSGSWCLEMWV